MSVTTRMKIVYLVRHGESETNAGTVFLGDTSPLTERGCVQADMIAGRASRLPIDIIVSSTMTRARQTAKAIAQQIGKPIVESGLFVERAHPSSDVGRAKNHPRSLQYTEEFFNRIHDPEWRFEDAENFSDLNERAKQALEYLVARPEEHILVTTHGLFMRVLLGRAIYGEAFTGVICEGFVKALRTENCGLSIIRNGRQGSRLPWELLTWNDHAHLG